MDNQEIGFGKMTQEKEYLYLTLKKPQFAVTSSGEKKIEYRRLSKWIISRLENKNYKFIKFTNGYGNDKPYFTCKFEGWKYSEGGVFQYSNGLKIDIHKGDIEIALGEIIDIKK